MNKNKIIELIIENSERISRESSKRFNKALKEMTIAHNNIKRLIR